MEISVTNRRVTLFSSTSIQFNEDLVKAYVDEFSPKDLVPSVSKGKAIKFTPKGVTTEDVISLELKKLDDTFRVVFGVDRIDIESTKTGEVMSDFLSLAKEIEATLSSKMNLMFVRLALYESVVFQIDDAQRNKAYGIFAKNEAYNPVEWQFQDVKRSSISSKHDAAVKVDVNEVYSVRCPETNGENLLLIDLDINTKVGATNEQISAIRDDFWPYASEVINNAVNKYKAQLENVVNQ